ncbi:MAG: DUF2845 domain-containing protein [Desulfobacterales bacterium]|nr:MAG: DUF2845 domain-containing protein [Desulfobacterales bacterium]
MKRIKIYFFGIAFLAMVLGGNISLHAAEETSSMMCDGGVVNIGDSDVDVRDNCGEPNTQGANQWVYDFGPSESYTVIFEDGKVVRILEGH